MTASKEQAQRCRDVLEVLLRESPSLHGTSLTIQQDSGSWAVMLLIDDASVSQAPTTAVPLVIRRSGPFQPD